MATQHLLVAVMMLVGSACGTPEASPPSPASAPPLLASAPLNPASAPPSLASAPPNPASAPLNPASAPPSFASAPPSPASASCQDGWAAFGEHCYLFSNEAETYNSARSKCQTTGGDLVSIHSSTENVFLLSLLDPDDYTGTWIGMSDDGHPGSLAWSDGTATVFTSWETSETYRWNTQPSCVGFSSGASGRAARPYGGWSLHTCHAHMHFVCKRPQQAWAPDTPKEGCAQCSSRRKRSSGLELSRETPAPSFSSPFHSRFSTPFKRGGSPHYQLPTLHTSHGNTFGQSPRNYPKILLPHRFGDHTQDNNGNQFSQPQPHTPQRHPLQSVGTLLHYQSSEAAPQRSNVTRGSTAQTTTPPLAAASSESIPASPRTDSNSSTTVDSMGQDTLTPTLAPEAGQTILTSTLPLDTRGCELGDETFNGSCYSFSGSALSWSDAQADCQTRNAQLIVLNNRLESAFISPLLRDLGDRSWIGLSITNEVFSWVNGAPTDFSNWDSFLPALPRGSCVTASGAEHNAGQWAMENCHHKLKYICEYDREGDFTLLKITTVNCDEGWHTVRDRCLKLFPTPTPWRGAVEMCFSTGGQLASQEDALHQIMSKLPGFTHVIGRNSSVWVGLKINLNIDQRQRYSYYNPDGLSDFRGPCISADMTRLKSSFAGCDEELPFVCEKIPGTASAVPPTQTLDNMRINDQVTPNTDDQTSDSMCTDDPSWYLFENYCYKFFSKSEDADTWWGSHRRCRDEKAELASIHSSKENNWILSKAFQLSDEILWVGGRAEIDHGYEWIDGTPFNFVNWAAGEPNNFMYQEDCISLYNHEKGYWNDANCGKTYGRVCKRLQGTTHLPILSTEVSIGHCPSGWTHIGTKCIQIFTEKKKFTEALEACRDMDVGVDLASIHSVVEQAYLTAVLGTLGTNVWVGLRNIKGFQWADQTAFTYSNWGPTEPNGAKMLRRLRPGQNPEDCVELLTHNQAGLWNDIDCDVARGYVCQRTVDPDLSSSSPPPACEPPFNNYIRFNDACYRPDSNAKTWQEAEATCIGEGGHLASIHYLSENVKMWILIQEAGFTDAWIGFNNLQDGLVYKWSDGWPPFYSNWGHEEPNSSLSNHNCTRMRTENGLWFNESCNKTSPFICKFKNGTVPTPDPPTTGYCPDSRWLDFGGGYCYLISTQRKPWMDANMNCIQEHADLVSVHSEAEMAFLTKAMHHSIDPVWIGLVQKKDGYGWSDNTALDFIYWENGEPNSENEQCTEASPATGRWNDISCSVALAFTCKTLKLQHIVSTEPLLPTDPAAVNTHPSGLRSDPPSAGSITGIIIAMLTVAAGVGYVGYSYVRKKRKSARACYSRGFEL